MSSSILQAHQGEIKEAEQHQKQVQNQELLTRFHLIDVNHDGKITKAEFEYYLQRNPTGWPLGDLLRTQTKEQQKTIIEFWFRKVDVVGSGVINQDEFLGFFRAMSNLEYREYFLTDFLLNLFDENMDGSLDRAEYVNMLTVLLGKAPSPALVSQVMSRADSNHDGKLSREELRQLLHRVHGDLTKLGGSNGGITEVAFLVIGVITVAVIGIYSVRYFATKK